ncbi:MAG: hypothetical protein ACRDJ9_07905, partial [Dehalococcoidia bacterium]
MPAPEELLLPPAARLVHIGPHKTGTTAVQGAFHLARDRLASEYGVHYAGKLPQPGRAAMAVTGQPTLIGEKPPQPSDWADLVAEVAAAGGRRVVISSEFFAEADDAAARRVVEELGGRSAHVVVTLRPLAKILPSQWQQTVQNGLRTPYDDWLAARFNTPDGSPSTRKFWQRHHHGRLVRRWAEVAGAERVTVIVADERDPQSLLRTFESMVGLPPKALETQPDRANRSLTLAEAEIIRRLNLRFRALEWPEQVYAKHLRRGAITWMKTERQPSTDEPRIATPTWALKRAAELGAEFAETIASLGVRVVGDLSWLSRPPEDEATAETTGDALLPAADAAAEAVIGAIAATGDPDP